MAWYHRYRYAEVVSADYPQLRHRALPIVRFEISIKRCLIKNFYSNDPEYISKLFLSLNDAGTDCRWFNRDECILYRGMKQFATLPDSKYSESLFSILMRKLRHKGTT